MSELSMLLYTSLASPGLDDAAVDALAAQAQVCNTEADITSALLVHGGRVLHAMEGPSSAVQACYARIAADSRHSHVNLLAHAPCQQRRFAGWRLRRVRVHASFGASVEQVLDQLAVRPDAQNIEAGLRLLQNLAPSQAPGG